VRLIVCSGGMLIVARVVPAHVVHLPRLHVDLLDNGTQLIEVFIASCLAYARCIVCIV